MANEEKTYNHSYIKSKLLCRYKRMGHLDSFLAGVEFGHIPNDSLMTAKETCEKAKSSGA